MEMELKDLLTKQGEAFEAFKKANDDRLKAIESKGYAPADLTGKVEQINADLSQLGKDIAEVAKKSARPNVGNDTELSQDEVEHKQAFKKFVRKGEGTGLADLEKKVFQMGSDVDGGYLISKEMDGTIERVAATVSTVRNLAEVRPIGKEAIKFRVKTSGTAARWV